MPLLPSLGCPAHARRHLTPRSLRLRRHSAPLAPPIAPVAPPSAPQAPPIWTIAESRNEYSPKDTVTRSWHEHTSRGERGERRGERLNSSGVVSPLSPYENLSTVSETTLSLSLSPTTPSVTSEHTVTFNLTPTTPSTTVTSSHLPTSSQSESTSPAEQTRRHDIERDSFQTEGCLLDHRKQPLDSRLCSNDLDVSHQSVEVEVRCRSVQKTLTAKKTQVFPGSWPERGGNPQFVDLSPEQLAGAKSELLPMCSSFPVQSLHPTFSLPSPRSDVTPCCDSADSSQSSDAMLSKVVRKSEKMNGQNQPNQTDTNSIFDLKCDIIEEI